MLVRSTGGGSGNEKLAITRNQQWSVTALTDATSGTVLERYTYDHFGKRTILEANGTTVRATSSYNMPFGYTSRQHDAETGLMYFRARYYDPHSAEFISPDPLEYVDGTSLFRGYFLLIGVDPHGFFTRRTDDDSIWDGLPSLRDWCWLGEWATGREDTLFIEGDLLEEFKKDGDVISALIKIRHDLKRNAPVTCEKPSAVWNPTGKTEETVQLQDTIYSIGNTYIYWSASCKANLICCEGPIEWDCWGNVTKKAMKPWKIDIKCDIKYLIHDSFSNPFGDKLGNGKGFLILGDWSEVFEDSSVHCLPCGK